jgi:hypothetical protein
MCPRERESLWWFLVILKRQSNIIYTNLNKYYELNMICSSMDVRAPILALGERESHHDLAGKRKRKCIVVDFKRATTSPSPIGILRTADSIWKTTKQRPFFGYSYTSPTPTIYTLQKLGLGITKAFALHIRNAGRKQTHTQPFLSSRRALDKT